MGKKRWEKKKVLRCYTIESREFVIFLPNISFPFHNSSGHHEHCNALAVHSAQDVGDFHAIQPRAVCGGEREWKRTRVEESESGREREWKRTKVEKSEWK